MKTYIATFYSHFGALTFYKTLEKMSEKTGIEAKAEAKVESKVKAKLMPVPRKLSSSCGTCVQFISDKIIESFDEDLEAVYLCENNEYICKIRNTDS